MLAIRAAILPAVTTVLSAYEVLYAFERIAKLRDAARNLRRVETPRLAESVDAQAAVASYASRVEQILSNEHGQWGQLAVEHRPNASRADLAHSLANAVQNGFPSLSV